MKEVISAVGGFAIYTILACLIGFIWEIPYCGKISLTALVVLSTCLITTAAINR